jgi:hypothetical protein
MLEMTEMMQRLAMPLGVCLLISLGACQSAGASEQAAKPVFPEPAPYPEVFQRLEQARVQAREEQKLLMLVLGAEWCHDSRGFVRKFDEPGFAALIEERYEVLLVNVGLLEYIRDIVERYQVPVIYGTPTVLVIEPASNTLLNRETLPYWRNADAISNSDTLAYFQAFRPGQLPATPATPSPALAAALEDIDRFEQQQAERIYLAYAELGDMMRDLDPESPSADFQEKWENLGQMRSSITVDLSALRSRAREMDASGVDPIHLQYPTYELFIDGQTP